MPHFVDLATGRPTADCIADAVTTIGRDTGNDIVLGLRTVSKRHAGVWLNHDTPIVPRWRVMNLSLVSPITVNGVQVLIDTVLPDGALVAIGGCRLKFIIKRTSTQQRAKSSAYDTDEFEPVTMDEIVAQGVIHNTASTIQAMIETQRSMATMARLDLLYNPRNDCVSLWVHRGCVVGIRAGHAVGPSAMAELTSVRFSSYRLVIDDMPPPLSDPKLDLDSLIMELVRLSDERRRVSSTLTRLHRKHTGQEL